MTRVALLTGGSTPERDVALAGAGGEAMVKMDFAEALKGIRILFVPSGDAGGLDVRSTDINSLIGVRGVQSLIDPRANTDK